MTQQEATERCEGARTSVCEVFEASPGWAVAAAVLLALIIIVLVCRYQINKHQIPPLEEQEAEAQDQLYPGRRPKEIEPIRDDQVHWDFPYRD